MDKNVRDKEISTRFQKILKDPNIIVYDLFMIWGAAIISRLSFSVRSTSFKSRRFWIHNFYIHFQNQTWLSIK